jgi:hypothetical protein
VEITDGAINIYTVSGKKVRRLDIPPGARLPGQNAVFWDGRDTAGGQPRQRRLSLRYQRAPAQRKRHRARHHPQARVVPRLRRAPAIRASGGENSLLGVFFGL